MKGILLELLTKLQEPKNLITILALVLLGAVLIVVARKTRFNTKTISYGAICIALSFLLSYVKVFHLPNGGSITIASMLPMFVFAGIAGPWAGIVAGLCYGLLQYIQEPYFVHPIQFLLDYPLAFGALGLAGFFGRRIWLGSMVGGIARLICHFLSGVVFFAEYAGNQNVFLYSLSYNASFLVPDFAICMVILAIPSVKSAIYRIFQTREDI